MIYKSVIFSAVILVSLSLFSTTPLSDAFEEPTNAIDNYSFERVTTSIYESAYWATNNGGYRALQGDITGPDDTPDGRVNMRDVGLVCAAFGARPGDPHWNTDTNPEGPDLDGDEVVNMRDVAMVTRQMGYEMGQDAFCIDGVYSWHTSGGGNYEMWQWLDTEAVTILAGVWIKFSFNFYPESVLPDGTRNNARAGIYYLKSDGGENTVYGSWVTPTYLDWWEVDVVYPLPYTAVLVAIIIEGKPDFKAWIDLAQIPVHVSRRLPPYSNQETYPEDGKCKQWVNAMICVDANYLTGQAWVYSQDASGAGVGKVAYAKFNTNPPIGNSPAITVGEDDSLKIGAYWNFYGYLGSGGYSSITHALHLYYLILGQGWEHVGTYEWTISNFEYPGQAVYYCGAWTVQVPLPPRGAGTYAVAVESYTYAGGNGGSAVADFLFGDYYNYIECIKIS